MGLWRAVLKGTPALGTSGARPVNMGLANRDWRASWSWMAFGTMPDMLDMPARGLCPGMPTPG